MSSEESKKFREAQRKGISSNSQTPRGASSKRQKPTPRTVSSKPTYQKYEKTRNVSLANYKASKSKNDKVVDFPTSVYTAQAGTAYEANSKKKIMSPKLLKFVSILLAAAIGLGTITVLGNYSKATDKGIDVPTITQLEDRGVNTDKIGMQEDTVELLEKYDEFFTNFDPDKAIELSATDVINMAKDIELLNFNTIKDKVASLKGVSRDDVKLWYKFDEGSGSYSSQVRINEDDYFEREIFRNDGDLVSTIGNAVFGKKDSIPQDVADLIIQTGEYDEIINELQSDKITKKNAIIKLKELYMNISENIATKKFTIDDKGNIGLEDYSAQTKDQREQEKGEER